MSHPLIVEAAEDLFVPVAIHNNKDGHDGEVRERFDEPAWNYPVARYVGAEGADLIERKDRVYSVQETAARMAAALEVADVEVPAYLALLAAEASDELTYATFAMG